MALTSSGRSRRRSCIATSNVALDQPLALQPPQRVVEGADCSFDVGFGMCSADKAAALKEVHTLQEHARVESVVNRVWHARLQRRRPDGPPPIGRVAGRPLHPDRDPEGGALAVYESGDARPLEDSVQLAPQPLR